MAARIDPGRSGVGLLAAAAGAGTFLAIPPTALLIGSNRLARVLGMSLALCALPLGAIGGFAQPVPAAVLVAFWGAAMCFADVSAAALLPRVVQAREIGRVVGFMEGFKLLLEGIGALLAPGLIALLGVRSALVAVGVAIPLLVAVHRAALARTDAHARHRSRLLEIVRRIPILGPLRVVALERVVAALRAVSFPAGRDIVQQGEQGGRLLYVVDEGELAVKIDGRPVGSLGPGESFGEIALLHDVERTATVSATTDARLWSLDRDDVVPALTGAWRELPPGERNHVTAGERRLADLPVAEALRRNRLFAALAQGSLERLAASAIRVALEPGTTVIRTGDSGDRVYLVLNGTAEVRRESGTSRLLGPGETCGEIAVLHGVPRTATVVARTRLELLVLEREPVLVALGMEVA